MMAIMDQKQGKDGIEQITEVLTTAFKDDPLYQEIFESEKELRRYLRLMADYYNHNGEVHTAVVDGEIVGVSVWNFKGTPFFSLRSALKCGMFGEVLKFLMITRIKSLIKLKNEELITERYHYNREHHYLFMIGSVMRGAGRTLMEYAIEKFSDCPIYLENSNVKKNRIFYERLGFHPIKRIEVLGVSMDLLTNSKGEQLI
jgi:GNAT superfamily N-acetyltransferase